MGKVNKLQSKWLFFFLVSYDTIQDALIYYIPSSMNNKDREKITNLAENFRHEYLIYIFSRILRVN